MLRQTFEHRDRSTDAGQGVGARLPRKEDDRFMRGRGQYVADIRLAGLQDLEQEH